MIECVMVSVSVVTVWCPLSLEPTVKSNEI